MSPSKHVKENIMGCRSNIAKNIVIAVTLGLAAFASWAMTDLREPTIEAAISQTASS